METFNSSDLNFSNSAISHFKNVLKQRGKDEGIKLGIKIINIGNRQEGRTQAGDIINIPAKSNLIKNKIRLVLKNKVKQKIINRDYLKKGATKKVLRIIEKLDLKKKFNKNFFDVNYKY